mgnify:CR=1 FL=1
MKITLIRNFFTAVLMGLFAQVSLAQEENAMGALKEVADIVASINHFPSDADKVALASIAGNDNLPQGVRNMATGQMMRAKMQWLQFRRWIEHPIMPKY